MSIPAELLEQVLGLPEDDRYLLMEAVARSLGAKESDQVLSAEWQAEIRQRIARTRSGEEAVHNASSELRKLMDHARAARPA
jgi:hypothetical protein